MRASTEPVRSTSFRERKGTPRLSLRTVESVARKLARNLEPGSRSRAQNFSLFRGGSLPALPLHGPRRQPRDDAALEDQDQYHERYRHHDRRRGLRPVVYGVDRGEVRDGDRHRLGALVEKERVGEQELVPGVDERQYSRGEYSGRRERHYDLAERLYRRRPVYLGRVLEVDWRLPEERHKQADRQRQGEDRIGDDHRCVRVYEADQRVLDKERGDDRHRGEEADREYQGHHGALETEPHPGDRVGRYGAEEEADYGGHRGDYRAVYERLLEHRVAKDLDVFRGGRVLGQDRRRRGEELGLGHDAHLEDPEERGHAHQNEGHEEDVEEDRAERPSARCFFRSSCAGHRLFLLHRGSHAKDSDKEERYEERRYEYEDSSGVTWPELELADPHALVDVRAEGCQLPVAHHPEQVVDPVGIESAEEDCDQYGALEQRQSYPEKALHPVRPIHPRGLVDLGRDDLEPRQEQERHERRRLPHVDQDGSHQQERPAGEYGLADDAKGIGRVLDDPDLVLEHQAPHDRSDDRGKSPRHEHGGPDQTPAPEGPVYREGYSQADEELQGHARHRKDHGVG